MIRVWYFLVHEARLFAVALQFFTRVPVALRRFDPQWLNEAARYFPLVGGLVGVFGAAGLLLAASAWSEPVAVVASMALTAWFTGGFHEDGLADTCDGLGGAVSRDRALEIMKDSRVGSYGVLGLVFTLGAKAAATLALCRHDLRQAALIVVFAHIVSRAMPVILLRVLPYAGDIAHAKAKPLARQVGTASLAAALSIAAVAAVLGILAGLSPRGVATATVAALVVTGACARWFKRRIGGFTGDTLGAVQQWSELAVLLGFGVGLSA
jgi:adenosylcobinamide-GDP ribazoletransferase